MASMTTRRNSCRLAEAASTRCCSHGQTTFTFHRHLYSIQYTSPRTKTLKETGKFPVLGGFIAYRVMLTIEPQVPTQSGVPYLLRVSKHARSTYLSTLRRLMVCRLGSSHDAQTDQEQHVEHDMPAHVLGVTHGSQRLPAPHQTRLGKAWHTSSLPRCRLQFERDEFSIPSTLPCKRYEFLHLPYIKRKTGICSISMVAREKKKEKRRKRTRPKLEASESSNPFPTSPSRHPRSPLANSCNP